MEQVLLETITNQMKQVTEKSQHRFTKGLTNMITFYNKITSSVDMGRALMLFTWTSAKCSPEFPTSFSWTNWQDADWTGGL